MPAPIRILHVIDYLNRGGVQTQLVDLCKALDKNAFDLSLVYFGKPEAPLGQLLDLGVRVFYLPRTWKADPRGIFGIARLIRVWDIDIVHCWLRTGNLYGRLGGMLAAATSLGRRVPVLLAGHQNSRIRPGEEAAGSKGWRSTADRLHLRLDLALQRFTRTLVVNAEAIKREYVEDGYPASAITVIVNGKDLSAFRQGAAPEDARKRLEIAADALVVATVCRLVPRKNVAMLLRAVATLRGKGIPLVAMIIGDGPERENLESLAGELGLGGAVRFLGPRDDIPQVLPACDVFSLSSRPGEGIPFAIVEAMALGKPVIATNSGGVAEAVLHEQTGLVTPLDDLAAFTHGLERLCVDGRLRQRLGEAGRKRAFEEFSVDTIADEFAKLYQSCVARR